MEQEAAVNNMKSKLALERYTKQLDNLSKEKTLQSNQEK